MSLACLRSPDCLPYTSCPSPPVMSSVYTTVSMPLHLLSPWAWCALSCCHLVSMSHFRFLCSDARWRFSPLSSCGDLHISLTLFWFLFAAVVPSDLKVARTIYGLSVGWVENIWEEIMSVLDMCGLFFFLSTVPISCSKTTMCWLVLPTCGTLESPKKRASIEELARSSLPMRSPWGIVC